MKPITTILDERISKAISTVTGADDCPAMIIPAKNPKFGDYQANGVMAAAKKAKTNPRELAQKIVDALEIEDICETPEIAGPGFINLRLKDEFLADRLLEVNKDTDRLGIDKADTPQTVVVDYSGPNIAKQMHVGHLRSTIIGDCIARLYEFEGHTVIRQNHIGDWGLQMGMVIYALEEYQWGEDIPNKDDFHLNYDLDKLENYYKKISAAVKEDPEIEKKVKKRTADLHAQEPVALVTWRQAREITLSECHSIYERLDVTLTDKDVRGESDYKDSLADVVETLKQKGLAKESEEAICVFPPGFQNKEGNPLPFIIQKSDGAFLYATTDLAALRDRTQGFLYNGKAYKADKIIYVTDARQAQHFAMLFETVKMAGWTNDEIELLHVTFGTMLGEDGKPFKTRTGGTVKLKDLLDEAVERATSVVQDKNPDLPADQKNQIAKAVGIGAVKYADYSNNRNSDFIFSFDKMLAMEGNTAPYMQYAYARIKSIERKASKKDVDIKSELSGIQALTFTDDAEKDLAKMLIRYDQAIFGAAAECRPNYLTSYLYDLSQAFSRFYNACPVLKADDTQRPVRLLLCDLTARTIEHGLTKLLGIKVVEQM